MGGLSLRIGLGLGHAVSASGGGGDVTAPTLSSPTGSATGSTTATVGVTTNEGNGTLYWVVTTSSTAPTKAQVKAGQNDAGSAAVASGSQAISSTGAKTANATGLTASTTYYAHFMHEDAAANQSTVASYTTGFTTSATATTLQTTNGTRKSSDISLSGGNLTASGTRNVDDSVSASAKTTTSKFIVEFTLTFTSSSTFAYCGIDDGSFDMSSATGQCPGLYGEGISVEVNTTNSPNFHKDGADQGFFGSAVASPLVVTFVVDTTTGTNNVLIYYTITGTTTLIKTLSWTPATGNWWAWVGARNAATVTANFGGSAFTYSPVGYSAYG